MRKHAVSNAADSPMQWLEQITHLVHSARNSALLVERVLQLLKKGRNEREIGTELGLSRNVVREHVQSILAKLGVSRRTEAATVAHRSGMFAAADADADPNPVPAGS